MAPDRILLARSQQCLEQSRALLSQLRENLDALRAAENLSGELAALCRESQRRRAARLRLVCGGFGEELSAAGPSRRLT